MYHFSREKRYRYILPSACLLVKGGTFLLCPESDGFRQAVPQKPAILKMPERIFYAQIEGKYPTVRPDVKK
ncbi:MAG TPA: hypothetical protein DEP43_03955 [Ruminococcaceae bacterium]|nr:hypothetical protein [Oscillospiraceae bacterium]